MTVDLVVSCYRDDVAWTLPLLREGVRLFLYDKWDGERRLLLGADVIRAHGITVERLENTGYCDGSYAHHVVSRYDSLADWTVFSPDGPHDHLAGCRMEDAIAPGDCLKVPRLWRGRDWGPDGRLNWRLWDRLPKRGGTSWKAHWESGRVTPAKLPFPEWMRRYVGFDPDSADWPGYAPGGIYAVPRKAIQYLPRAFYERLLGQVSHAVESEECHYLERSWPTIWSGRARYAEGA